MDRLAFNGLGYRQPITTRLAASLGVILRRHILVTPPDTLPPCTRARANGVRADVFFELSPRLTRI